VMAGMVAVAWPSLIKPLTQSELKQAAWTVRDALDEARRMASNSGDPTFCLLRNDSQEIIAGNFEQILQYLEDSQSTTSSSGQFAPTKRTLSSPTSSMSPASSTLRRWEIPADVRIEHWMWTSQPAEEPDEESSFPNLDRLTSPRSLENRKDRSRDRSNSDRQQDLSRLDVATSRERSGDEPIEPERWIVTMLPDGRSPDATIRLWSEKASKSIDIVLYSATGMIEVRP
jgi:hypothetical protein